MKPLNEKASPTLLKATYSSEAKQVGEVMVNELEFHHWEINIIKLCLVLHIRSIHIYV